MTRRPPIWSLGARRANSETGLGEAGFSFGGGQTAARGIYGNYVTAYAKLRKHTDTAKPLPPVTILKYKGENRHKGI